MNFKRELYVKDLFRSEDVLNFFQCIEVENIQTLFQLISNNLLKINWENELIIPLKNKDDIELFIKLSTESLILSYGNINILISPSLLKELFSYGIYKIWSSKFIITLTNIPNKMTIRDYVLKFPWINIWIKNNPIIIREIIIFKEIQDKVQEMIRIFKTHKFRFFDLKFDYKSFEEMKINEIDEVEFWLNNLCAWRNQPHPDNIVIKYSNKIYKSIFVSSDLKLYYDNLKTSFLFDLKENIYKNGEEIPSKELNKLRQYLDLKKEHMQLEDNFNCYLIDYAYNSKESFVNEVPLITRILENLIK